MHNSGFIYFPLEWHKIVSIKAILLSITKNIKLLLERNNKMPGKSRRDFLKTSAIIGAGVTGISSAANAGPKNIFQKTEWVFW